ncbi:MAG: hypothetical protein U9N54_09275 [candidate division Zixibacteria bacterium]|nr:hypothetical protein [candidate division Zixibacteria bacterium]
MKSISLWTGLSIMLIVVNVALILLWMDSKRDYEAVISDYELSLENARNELMAANWYVCISNAAKHKTVNLNGSVTTSKLPSRSVKDFLHPNGTYILRFFNSSCLSCYEKGIKVVRDFINQNPDIPFVVATDFSDVNQLKNFIGKMHFKCEVIGVQDLILFEFEETDLPYVLHVNVDGQVSDCLAIKKNGHELLMCSLSLIKKYE